MKEVRIPLKPEVADRKERYAELNEVHSGEERLDHQHPRRGRNGGDLARLDPARRTAQARLRPDRDRRRPAHPADRGHRAARSVPMVGAADEGQPQSVVLTVTHAGIVNVKLYSFEMP
jgi:hypothetical protein